MTRAAWQFVPPADVEQRDECPPGVECRKDGEFFSRQWLAAAGEAGPLADSVVKAPSAPVYAALPDGGRWTAYCRVEPATVRPLLKLPDRLGLPDPTAAVTGTQPVTLLSCALWSAGACATRPRWIWGRATR